MTRATVVGTRRGAALWRVGAVTLALEEGEGTRELVAEGPVDELRELPFPLHAQLGHTGATRVRLPADGGAAAAVRRLVPTLAPAPLGLVTSAGFGDRLGLATPGHARAWQRSGQGVAPIFAQQSIREMTRTGREPVQVLDDATWGAFRAGVEAQVGADADHLKTTDDADRCLRAGFSLFTVDPGEHVDPRADDYGTAELRAALDRLPWPALESTWDDTRGRLASHVVDAGEFALAFDEERLARAAAKYGAAVAHAARLYRHLASQSVAFELEVSVDETATPTSHLEHAYLALELRRLGVRWVGLAPRFVGAFEKGVDYLGDPGALRDDVERHAAVARALGPYKLSLHSGSDKFSVYGMFADATGGRVHLKTAGTSYLEALRVIARVAPELFRDVLALAREAFARDRASYHVHAELARVPLPHALAAEELPGLLDDDHARQVLHVTYGSVLDRFRDVVRRVLRDHEEDHFEALATHFDRHLAPFAEGVR